MSKASRPIPSSAPRAPKLSVAPFEGFDRTATLAIPQELVDQQLVDFTEGELKVMLAVMRATGGGQREGIPLSVRIFCHGGAPEVLSGRGTGLSARTVQAACAALAAGGYLRVTRRTAPDGSGMPSLFTIPLLVPGIAVEPLLGFPGYASGRRVRIPLLVVDRLMAELSGAELKVLLYVLRHTFCVGAPDEVMPMARLVENTGLSLRHTRLATSSLSTRSLVLVQHRQDPERGKLPSRFGVRVIGESAPFSAAAGVAPVRSQEPVEPSRAVWLVPEPDAASQVQAPPLQVVAAGGAEQPMPSPRALPVQVGPGEMDGRMDEPLRKPREPGRKITEEMLQDNHPVWAAVKRILVDRLPVHVFDPWIAATASVNSDGVELLIAVPSEHHRWFLESKLHGRVRDALVEAGYPEIRLRYLNYNGVIPRAPIPE